MSDLAAALRSAVTDAAQKANSIVERVAASRKTTSGKVVSDLRDKSDLSEVPESIRADVEKYRANLEKIDATREKLVADMTEKVKAALPKSDDALTDDQISALKAEHAAARKVYREAINFAKSLGALSEDDVKSLPEVKNFGGSTSAATGEGGRKPRFDQIVVNGQEIFEEKGDKKIVTLTVLASWMNGQHKGDDKWTKVTTGELFEHLSAEAKTEDLSEVTDVSLGKFRGEYNVTVYPRQAE